MLSAHEPECLEAAKSGVDGAIAEMPSEGGRMRESEHQGEQPHLGHISG